jgi:Lar family restriction alleviation protein
MATELKPCPFCGGKAVMYGQVFYYIVCKSCGVETQGTYSEQSAAEAWNRMAEE